MRRCLVHALCLIVLLPLILVASLALIGDGLSCIGDALNDVAEWCCSGRRWAIYLMTLSERIERALTPRPVFGRNHITRRRCQRGCKG